MNESRRKFLTNSSLVLGGSLLFSKRILANDTDAAAKQVVGIQLYSIREEMKKDPLGSLKLLAAMGYKNVEHANYENGKFYGYPAKEFKKILKDMGLKMPSGHSVLAAKHWDKNKMDFTADWKQTIEDAAIAGQQYVISPWLDESLRKSYDELAGFLDVFNKCGELCKKSGVKFGYHNHDFEFKYSLNNKSIYDIILEKTDPALVVQQIDIGNMYSAGGMALDIIKKYPGRFESMHVKDVIKVPQKNGGEADYESTILGKGIIPVKEIIDLALKTGGTKVFIIEQESYQNKTPMDCSKADLSVMKGWGY